MIPPLVASFAAEGAIHAEESATVAPRERVPAQVVPAKRQAIPPRAWGRKGGKGRPLPEPSGAPEVLQGRRARLSRFPLETTDLRDLLELADLVRAIAEEG